MSKETIIVQKKSPEPKAEDGIRAAAETMVDALSGQSINQTATFGMKMIDFINAEMPDALNGNSDKQVAKMVTALSYCLGKGFSKIRERHNPEAAIKTAAILFEKALALALKGDGTSVRIKALTSVGDELDNELRKKLAKLLKE